MAGPFGSDKGRGSVVTATPLARRPSIVFVSAPAERQPMWSIACPSLGSASPRSTRIHTSLKPVALYSATGFSDVWILVERGEAEPSEGHAIDHIGWRSAGALTKTIEGLRAKGVAVTTEPRPLSLPNGPAINFSYVAGPAGAKIEIVERPGLKPGA